MMSYFADLANRSSKEIAPGVTVRTFWGSEMTTAYVNIDAGAMVPEHAHPAEQVGIVISGGGLYTIGGESRQVGPGDCYVIPGEVRHSFVAGDEPVVLYEAFSPARPELHNPQAAA